MIPPQALSKQFPSILGQRPPRPVDRKRNHFTPERQEAEHFHRSRQHFTPERHEREHDHAPRGRQHLTPDRQDRQNAELNRHHYSQERRRELVDRARLESRPFEIQPNQKANQGEMERAMRMLLQ